MQDVHYLDLSLRNLTIKKDTEDISVIKPHFKALILIILFPYTAAFPRPSQSSCDEATHLSKEVY